MANEKTTTNNVAQEQVTNEADFLSDFAGNGLDSMKGAAVSIPYLSMVQPGSACVDDNNKAGTWRNSASGKNYGTVLKVVPLAFRTLWAERDSNPPYSTVGRYPVNGIKVDIRKPMGNQKGYPKMINPQTGNEVQELFVYVLALPDYPEDGVVYFTPSISSMKTARKWNTLLKSQILPNGVQAPIFAYSWNIAVELVQNPKQASSKIAKFVNVDKCELINKDLFTKTVQPMMLSAKNEVLQLTSSESEVEVED